MFHVTPSNQRPPRALSSHALEALAQFNAERDARVDDFEKLKAQVEERSNTGAFTIESFTEDWNESQFWVNNFLPPSVQCHVPSYLDVARKGTTLGNSEGFPLALLPTLVRSLTDVKLTS